MMTGALESRAPSSAATTVDEEVQFWDENFYGSAAGFSWQVGCIERDSQRPAAEGQKAQEMFASGERRGCQRVLSSIISLVISSSAAAYRDSELATRYRYVNMGF